MLRESDLVLEDIGEGAVPVRALEGRRRKLKGGTGVVQQVSKTQQLRGGGTDNHLVDKDSERPPVDGRGVACSLDDLRRDVLCEG